MPKKRKAQGLSITTIIVAVIGLIVLVVLIAILTGKMGLFSAGVEGAASCENFCNSFNRDVSDPPDEDGKCVEGDQKVSGECCCKAKRDVSCTKKIGYCSRNTDCCSKSCTLKQGDSKKTCD